jgi:hypothetical protein
MVEEFNLAQAGDLPSALKHVMTGFHAALPNQGLQRPGIDVHSAFVSPERDKNLKILGLRCEAGHHAVEDGVHGFRQVSHQGFTGEPKPDKRSRIAMSPIISSTLRSRSDKVLSFFNMAFLCFKVTIFGDRAMPVRAMSSSVILRRIRTPELF